MLANVLHRGYLDAERRRAQGKNMSLLWGLHLTTSALCTRSLPSIHLSTYKSSLRSINASHPHSTVNDFSYIGPTSTLDLLAWFNPHHSRWDLRINLALSLKLPRGIIARTSLTILGLSSSITYCPVTFCSHLSSDLRHYLRPVVMLPIYIEQLIP
jgi:hypothetical protein